MPSSKALALVEFVEPSEARAAFKGLAYRRYNHTPIYLEWAPLGVIRERPVTQAKEGQRNGSIKEDRPVGESVLETTAVASTSAEFHSLFIKNFNFNTTEDALRQHLKRLGCSEGLRALHLPKKPLGRKTELDQVVLNMGYGFLEYATEPFAKSALVRLQGSVLDGHTLEAKPSNKRVSETAINSVLSAPRQADGASASEGSGNRKLVVRNVAFQATKAEIRSLFSAFGLVKSVRIPKKMDGKHRGFAFVEMATVREAELAKAALATTHFYGRHLILEWAIEEVDQSLDKLRKRAEADEGALQAERKRSKLTKYDGFDGPYNKGGEVRGVSNNVL